MQCTGAVTLPSDLTHDDLAPRHIRCMRHTPRTVPARRTRTPCPVHPPSSRQALSVAVTSSMDAIGAALPCRWGGGWGSRDGAVGWDGGWAPAVRDRQFEVSPSQMRHPSTLGSYRDFATTSSILLPERRHAVQACSDVPA